ncbi:uncharacterized protein LOC125665528 [Ostrea edulis]|uniref:uncharacterized protein LOC125665528 n=1 Tax=Ostrea edulis TaxID=37623 RepID=UPI0024AF46CD|nr:uncharacterized protein LOC125665528 [Ostrea edulis]
MICCSRNIRINNASKCVVDLCKFSMQQFQENITCTSTKDCPKDTKNATGADESAGIGYEGNEFISGSRNVGGGSKCGVWSRGQINTVDLFPTAVGVILGLAVLTTTCICCFFLCKRWSDEKKKKRKKFKRWDKKVRPLPQSRRVNIPIGCTVKNV